MNDVRVDQPQDLTVAMLRDMLRIRLVEEEIATRYAEQEMRCPVHLSTGQEAVAVGVCRALTKSDRAFSTHRCHAHYLAKGGDLKSMLAEIYGKAAGCLGGRGGSMHLADEAVSMHLSIPIIGSSVPLAVGTALADKMDGNNRVSVAFFGDATVEEGVFHECANFAALRKLPVIFVCENNFFSIYTPIEARQPDRPIEALGAAHGLNVARVDGNDIAAVYASASQAVATARSGKGSSLLVYDTFRWREHCGPNVDDYLNYRQDHDVEMWKSRCPIERLRKNLVRNGLLTETQLSSMRNELMVEVKAAFSFAKEAPLPDASGAKLHVYA